MLERIEQEKGIDVKARPYDFNLGQPKAGVVIDKSHQTNLYLVKRKILLAFIYLQQRFGVRFPHKMTESFYEGIHNSFALYEYVRDVSGAAVVVDSSKAYLKASAAYRAKPEHTRLIVLSRDGRGVLYSNIKRKFDRRAALKGWKDYYERALPIFDRNVLPEHQIRVKYEDLVARPEQELRRICDFIGLAYEEDMLQFAAKEHHIVAGNNMRFSKSSEIYSDSSWQQALAPADREYFMHKAGKLNRELGYS